MNRFLALALALAVAAPAGALPAAAPAASPNEATAPPADDAKCDTCDALQLFQEGDYRRGRHILELRAAKGDVSAVTGFGLMYQNGWGVPVDYGRAMGFYQNAAHQGDLLALNQIGYLTLHGLGTTADPKAAWCWFEQAAEGGFEKSAHHLAELMAAGMPPVSCKPSARRAASEAAAPDQNGAAGTAALELWNGVREGMTPDQVAARLTAPFRAPGPWPAPFDDHHPITDAVLAPAALFGHPAIAQVLFDDHAARVINLMIDPQSDDPNENLRLAREFLKRFDETYGVSLQVTDQGGALSALWTRGDLSIDLEYMPLPDEPPTFMVVFKRASPADRHAPSIYALPAPGRGTT